MSRWEGMDEFVAVVESGSFSLAAQRLRVSASHISRQVARLEERLQTRLLYRTTRKVSLTEAGQGFHERCLRLIEAREEAYNALDEFSQAPQGLLRMTCSVTYGERFVVPLVNRFMAQHPQLEVFIELSNRSLDLVHEGFDLAIRMGSLPDSSLVASRLAARRLHLCASPDYLARYGRPHTLSELSQHNCLVGSSDTWQFNDQGRAFSFKPHSNWRCNSGTAIVDATLQGLGLCQLPDYYVNELLATGHLVELLPQYQPPDAAVWAVYPQRRYVLPRVSLLIEHLRQGLALITP